MTAFKTPSPQTLAELTAGSGARRLRIALVAGEASGDLLGADLIGQLKQRHPDAQFAGIGGDGMRAAGLEAWFDASELSVMGLAEVLRHLPRLLKLRGALRQQVLDWQPDVFIGIDAPDFNLGVEKWLKQRGVRTVHYVSPSVWAWREKRAQKIGRSADVVLCLFPMEPAIYARHGIDARYVGHPMADALPLAPDRAAARATLGLNPNMPVLAVLPGSRLGEINRLAADFIEAARQVAEQVPHLQVVIPAANAACRTALEPLLAGALFPSPRPQLLSGQAREAMVASDVVLLASGTATLEAMLAKRPMVVGYKVAPLSAWIARTLGLLKVKRFALPNVLADEDIAPELMQEDCTPQALSAAVLHWLRTPADVEALQPRYLQLHAQLRQDASARAADAVDQLLVLPCAMNAATPSLLVAGVDEAGRGPLAGPLTVAAVVFDPARPRINGLDDSKQLTAARRELLYGRIVERALAWHVVVLQVGDIDRLNIYQATMLGMRLAVEAVSHVAGVAHIDGNRVPPGLPCPGHALIGGDGLDRAIMAASILAKVTRDRMMLALHDQHPEYDFAAHKGYGTPTHLAALRAHGPCIQHRHTFAPVREAAAARAGLGQATLF